MSEHSQHHSKPAGEEPRWLDNPANVKKIVYALVAICALLFVADAFYHKHPYFAAESWFGFYAIYGFVMCVGLVLAAKLMRVFLMRDEDYYDNDR
ncbi:hypothetical protein NUH88_21890 [Nisaea acidiphila]|uniref:Uncharacterized protein n=1 Tax=Nisaea acidiphila TaxID=1862145 RepID=A0A9J7AUN3_9PROT|nr:hypothetical protein [Nisaea acidiphila]UUX50028.1 hypothetical protein NUH88_21890 [Nisaea acidiphila]